MLSFEHYLPVRLIFGRGKIALVGKVTSQHGKKALIVTGRNSTKKTGLLDKVIASLEEEKLDYLVFDQVEQNPLTTTVADGVKLVQEQGCDVIIGLGGGSSMDAAKGIAFSAVNPGDISEYIFGKPGVGALPVIAITTTAGTGSEGDCFAVLTNPVTKDKKSLKTPLIYPKASIVDPELMTTLPPKIVASTGIDALCHSIEAYSSQKCQPFTQMMALTAIELISKNLPLVYDDPTNLEAWDGVALANTLGGMCIDCSGVTLPHALEHPVSGLLDVVHGQGLAALIIPVMEYSRQAAPEKFAKMAQAMGEDITGLSWEEGAAKSVEAMKKLLLMVNLTPTLKDLGVTEEHIDWLAENCLKIMTAAIEGNPRVADLADIKTLYRQCL